MRAYNTWQWLRRRRDIGALTKRFVRLWRQLAFSNLKIKFSNNLFLTGRVAERHLGSMVQGIHDSRELVRSHVRERLLFQEELWDQPIRVFVFPP